MFRTQTTTLLLTLAMASPAFAHSGRRYEVKVVDNQIVAHGYLSDGSDDGGDNTLVNVEGSLINYRNYYNTIHDHFGNLTTNVALADLPGYDVLDEAGALIGSDLQWQIVGFSKWATPSMAGVVNLAPLDGDETLEVGFGGNTISSTGFTPGDGFTLLPNFTGSNGEDLDLSYTFIGDNPSGELYVVASVLSTSAAGIADSQMIYTILSPDGANPQEKLHHASLNAESQLSTPIPEPAALSLIAVLPVLMRRRRASVGCA